ncbi:MAG: DNA methyltransferase [Gammaproteobacteria bacterium]
MPALNVKNRTLFIRDNVDILDNLNSECADLIYLDPPFNSNRDYAAPAESQAAGAFFKDAWTLDDIDLAWSGQIAERHPALAAVISAAGMAGGKGDKAYLIFMARRLLEMHRILKSTGGVYLHCDPTMSHSLKLLMDAVFGKKNFRNEIVWKKTNSPKTQSAAFGNQHDVILSYSKSAKFTFNGACVQYSEKQKKVFSRNDNDGMGFYQTISLVAGGMQKSPRRKTFEFQGKTAAWLYKKETLQKFWDEGRIYKTPSGYRLKDYLKDRDGAAVSDIWTDGGVKPIQGKASENTQYPTQKPLALLERIIKASSNEGDVVLDPFCGCATTLVAAETLNRQWVGVDISNKAADLINARLQDAQDMLSAKGAWKKIITRENFPARTDNGAIMVNKKEHAHILYGMQEGNCAGCRCHFPFRNLTLDHQEPKSKGGQDTKTNLQLLCGACNSVKGDRPMAYLLAWLRKQGIIS